MLAKLFQFLTVITCLALVIQVTLVCLQVMAAGFIPDAFTREVSKYLMTWVTLLGLPLVVQGERQLAIHLWIEGPQWWQRTRAWARIVTVSLLCLVLLGFGVWNVILTYQSGTTTGALAVPKTWVVTALPVGMILTVIALFKNDNGESKSV